jgi:hypothetical protein
MRRISLLLLSLCASHELHAQPAATTKPVDVDNDRANAALLLFGTGSSLEPIDGGRKLRLSLDAKRGLTRADLARWADQYYRPAIDDAKGLVSFFDADRQIDTGNFETITKQGATGWMMSEPKFRREICRRVADKIGNEAARKLTLERCDYFAATMARTQLFEFDGTSVEFDASAGYGGTKLTYGTRLFAGGDLTLSIPGQNQIDKPRYFRVQTKLLEDIHPESQFFQKAAKLLEQNLSWGKAREAQTRALEKKQAGGGNKTVFGDRWFDLWDPQEAATGELDCLKVYWKSYGPANGHRVGNGAYAYKVKVDGKECLDQSQEYGAAYPDAWVMKLGGPLFLGRNEAGNTCSTPLIPIGKHNVTVEIWATKTRVTGHEWLADGRLHKLEVFDRTSMLASNAITCKTSDDRLQNIWRSNHP